MYITYCRNQKSVDPEDKTGYRLSVTGGDYRPTWLIRVSDWQKVPGKAAVNGYHTISYCWEQSGEVVRNDDNSNEYRIVDHAKHCIVEGYDVYKDLILGSSDFYDTREVDDQDDYGKGDDEKHEDDNIQDVSGTDKLQESDIYNQYVTWCQRKSKTTKIRYVTYEQLLQQVCKDFQVEYVWYDKRCIDQSNSKARSNEIKQMHKIYRNARYTIAMVPELLIYDPADIEHEFFGFGNEAQEDISNNICHSSWWKRSWTLEEVMMTKRILIVGTDINMFQHSLNTTDIPTNVDVFSTTLLDFGGTEQNKGSVNRALAFAHFRTSAKAHDMIYALKNTFSYMFNDIEANDATDIEATFSNFYRHIATNDLSILCFGSNLSLDGHEYGQHTMGGYNLPSWTGVAGKHIYHRAITTTHPELKCHIDETMWMHIKSKRYWKISVTPFDGGSYSLSKNSTQDADWYWEQMYRISSLRYKNEWTDMTTADKDTVLLEWLVNMYNGTGAYMTHYHQPQGGLLTQLRPLTLTEDCEECIILPILLELHVPMYANDNDNAFSFIIHDYDQSYCLPVLRECTEGTGRYKTIGVYYLGDRDDSTPEPSSRLSHYIGKDDINSNDPEEIISALFENDCYDVPKEFIIE